MVKKHIPDAENWKGGNKTWGKHRRGYRGGRKSLHPPGTTFSSVALKLVDPLYAAAMYIGHGNVSQGIRIALERCKALLLHCPENRDSVTEMQVRRPEEMRQDVARLHAMFKPESESKPEWDDLK